jgi:flagellar hook assembly protein FlgD
LRKVISKKLFAFGFFVIFFAMFSASSLKAAFLITSLSVSVSPAGNTAKIGDYILFQMAAINATATYSNVAGSVLDTNDVLVSSPDFQAGFPGSMAVYDDTHTWIITAGYYDVVNKVLEINDTNLVAGPPVGDYNSIKSAVFKASDGALQPGGTATVDILPALNGVSLYDNGAASQNDAAGGDGVYNAKYMIREISGSPFQTNQLQVRGHFLNGVSTATNDGMTIVTNPPIQIDAVRPVIKNVDNSPYIFNPNLEWTQFNYWLSKQSKINFNIYDKIGNVVRTMAATGYTGINQPITWDGLDNNGNMVPLDTDYTYEFDVIDMVGNTGAAITGFIKTTTVNLSANISSLDTNYNNVNGESELVVTAFMTITLENATTANLANLGFNYPELAGSHDYRNYPYVKTDLRIYDAGGTNMLYAQSRDFDAIDDSDPVYMNINAVFQPHFADGRPMIDNEPGYASQPFLPFVYSPKPTDECMITQGQLFTVGDGNPANDWDNTFGNTFVDKTGGVFVENLQFRYYFQSMTPGNYILTFKGQLVGKTIWMATPPTNGTANCPSNPSPINDVVATFHAIPSFFDDNGIATDLRGYGLSTPNMQNSFTVEPPPTVDPLDKTPPIVVPFSEIPSNGSSVAPNTVGKFKPVQVTLTDAGVGHGSSNNSKIILYDPQGIPVGGTSSWTAGSDLKSWTLIFTPDNPLTTGGLYTYTITPVDAVNNIGPVVTYSFTVIDTAAPIVNNVNVKATAGNSQNLSSSTSTQINFLVSSVEATIIPAGTSLVDWTASSIRVSGVAGNITHVDNTNIITFTPSSSLTDGSYTVFVTAVSQATNGNPANTAITSYNFNITTAGVAYVDTAPDTGETTNTYMRLLTFDPLNSGITENGGATIAPTSINVSIIGSPPASPSGETIIGNVLSFGVVAGYSLPVAFNTNKCSAILRMHFSNADISTLTGLGLTTSDLKLWVWDGAGWTQITGISAPVVTATKGNYIEVAVTSIPANDRYALAYTPPAIPVAPHHFDNTKAFNPVKGPAKLYYISDISVLGALGGTGNVKVSIYNLTGELVRYLEFQNPSDHTLFTSFDANPLNAGDIMYYLAWDGKNNKSSYVRNGLYMVKMEITTTSGVKSTISRAVAVVK